MSAFVHCDGPGCDETRPASPITRTFSTPYWIRVEERPDSEGRDFHSRECLTNWANGVSPTPTAVARTTTCVGCDKPATRRVGDLDWCDKHGPFVIANEGEATS